MTNFKGTTRRRFCYSYYGKPGLDCSCCPDIRICKKATEQKNAKNIKRME